MITHHELGMLRRVLGHAQHDQDYPTVMRVLARLEDEGEIHMCSDEFPCRHCDICDRAEKARSSFGMTK
jgi:hypothetical protein